MNCANDVIFKTTNNYCSVAGMMATEDEDLTNDIHCDTFITSDIQWLDET